MRYSDLTAPLLYDVIILQFFRQVNCVFTENKEICRIFLCAMQKREKMRKFTGRKPQWEEANGKCSGGCFLEAFCAKLRVSHRREIARQER